MKRILLITAILACGLCPLAMAQAITTHHVGDNIYMLEGRGGNIGVSIGDDGVLIIDDQFENVADAIRDAIAELHEGELKFILNTHHHGDHTGGNEALGLDTPIVAHENVRKRLLPGKDLANRRERHGLPSVTFDDDVTIHFNGDTIRIVHYPTGHTDTDSVIFFDEANVVHMGDHFFNGRFPFIDLASGGNVQSYVANVKAIHDIMPADVRIIPGHGPLASKADLKAFHDMLVESIGIIEQGIEAGKDLKTLQDEGLPEKFAEAGTGFISTQRWIAIVHQGLTSADE